ncbi:MAG: cation-translocating P-type ATPase [Oscillospiraceae bacterium]
MEYYRQSSADTLHALDSTPDGLTQAQADERLARDGHNVLAEPPKPSVVKRFFAQLADPMILVLLAAALVSAVTSAYAHESFADVIIILLVVIINAVLGVYQESKAEQAIAALKELSAAHSRVLRGGKIVTVPSETLVVGDVLVLEAGDAVPADARVIESASLRAEEAALTGESVPVSKSADALTADGEIGLGDRSNMLYLGSSIVYGRGRAVVTETGMQTQMGHIADALTQTKENKTPLQLRLSQLSRILTWLVLGICAIVFAVGVLRAGSISGRVVLDTFLIAVSLAVAAIPEGLAAVVTIVLSIGVTNMSRRSAVIRRLTAVETLGCAQIICTDKTGTLTQNRMTVTASAGSDEHLLATAMALCADAVHDPDTDTVTGEPTEAALVRWAVTQGLSPSALRVQLPRVAEAPFDSARKMMSTLHSDGGRIVQYTKGAPDVLLPLCDRIWIDGQAVPMTDAHRAEIAAHNRDMTGRALRVLAAAMRTYDALPTIRRPRR